MSKPSLAETHPEIAARAHGWDPTTVTSGSRKKRGWKCEEGHVWSAVVYSRPNSGCPTCGNKRVLVGFNDLATTHPEIAAQANGWDPTTVTHGMDKKREWKCQLGHIWMAAVGKRDKHGCPVCANHIVLIGFNDLKTTHPEIATQAHGWNPTTVTRGMDKKREWKCEKGHVWVASVCHRTGHGSGCPYCTNRKVLAGFNDLATTHPEVAAQAHGWDSTTVVAGSNKRLEWMCARGHVWSTKVSHRTGLMSGCPGCYHMTFEEMTQRPLKFRAKQRKYT